tara:strand:- start:341 stop:595 length:255 start_codon:yes stop_codon:yes gene_type:complete
LVLGGECYVYLALFDFCLGNGDSVSVALIVQLEEGVFCRENSTPNKFRGYHDHTTTDLGRQSDFGSRPDGTCALYYEWRGPWRH